MKFKHIALLCASTVLFSAASANATTVYSNGPIDGTVSGLTLGFGQEIVDSFTLSSTTTITGFTFGGWTNTGTKILSVDYGFSASNLGGVTNSATLTAGAIVPGTGFGGDYDVRDYAATIAPVTLGAGTWYFTLGNSATDAGWVGYWDVNNGPSSAYFNGSNIAGYFGPTSSEAFTLESSAAPEPASWAMMLGGFGAIGGAMRARRKAAVSFA